MAGFFLPIYRKVCLGLVSLAFLASAALAQPVTVIGPITPGDCTAFNSTTVLKDGGIPCGAGHFANPTGAVGLAVVNGVASTAMRSDAAPPLSASVQSALTGTNGQILVGTGGFGFASIVLGGDCTFTSPNIVCTKTGGVNFGPFATQAAPCSIAQGCTGQITATLGFQALAPVPTRAGDVIYWNGSAWVTLAGNNSGTQTLTENSSGVPSWSAAGSGSVTSVTCGTGLSGGTFTTSGTCAVNLTSFINSLGADVNLNNTGTYFDGPSVAQGTSGIWYASGTITATDTATANINCKLWDGTTVMASTNLNINGAGGNFSASLSGVITTPAANIRISCKDASTVNGKMIFNFTGNSKDSTVTAHRIQ